MSNSCLMLIDLQNDFMPGGTLAVAGADEVIPVANRAIARADHVVMTQDWHPPNHGSFASQHNEPDSKNIIMPGDVIRLEGIEQIAWPDHCIQGSFGAEFHPDLDLPRVNHYVRKGTDALVDSYSGFFDNDHRSDTGMSDYLRSVGVDELEVMGVATDYCVLFTVLDALELGFRVQVRLDGCRGVERRAGDISRAVSAMKEKGATMIH